METAYAQLMRLHRCFHALDMFGLYQRLFKAMSRRPRLVLPAVPLHIIQRGNNRSPCFACETDYRVYLSLLRQYAAETSCHIHAYVLMTNHVHLLLSTESTAGPSALMQRLGQHYVQYFNRRYQRTGTLWDGRFRSCLVESERYLLICQRYIELNPVRARMVRAPEQYPWSSYHANATGADDALITPHLVYRGLGTQDDDRRTAYRHLFREALSDQLLSQIRHASNKNGPLGSASFAQQTAAMLGRPTEPRRRGRPRAAERKLL